MILLALALLLVASSAALAADVFVSPVGDDAAAGSADRPMCTLKSAVERAIASGSRRVVLQGGKYYDTAVELDARANGLTIEPAPGQTPQLIGGRRITGWRREGEFFVAPVRGAKDRTWDFRMLIVNGRYAPRARLPREGRFTHENAFDVPWMSTTGGGWKRKPTEAELTTMVYRAGDLGAWLDIASAELTVYHAWDESVVGIQSLDAATRTVTFAQAAGHPPGAFSSYNPDAKTYVVWNVRQGLTRPGQWCLDRSAGVAVYWPLAGEDMAAAEVVAPTTERVICLRGTEQAPVENVTLRGLTVSVTGTPLIAGGFAASRFAGAVAGEHTRNCRLQSLHVVNVGGQGVRLDASSGATVEDCCVENCGAGGVSVAGPGTRIVDNHVHHVGLTYPSGALVLHSGGEALIAHNELHDGGYSGIIASGGRGTIIEKNLIYRVMEQLRDGAAVYITFCKAYTIRGNVTRNIRDSQAHAYYVDEQGDDCIVERNLSVNVPWPLHNHMAHDGVIRGNVCVAEGNLAVTLPKSERFTLERNVLVAGGDITIEAAANGLAATPNNLLQAGGKLLRVDYADYSRSAPAPLELKDGSESGGVSFRDAARGDYRLQAGCEAAKRLGIESLDLSDVGRLKKEGR